MATVAGSLRNKVLVLDDVTTGDLTVTGSVTIEGTATTINSTNTLINDHLIELNAGLTGANPNDTGIILERGTSGNNIFFGWDESADRFIVASTTADGSSTGNLSLTAADFQAGSFHGNGANITSLNAANLSSGTVPSARLSLSATDIPSLAASKITSGTFATARIPGLAASKITSGTFADARIPNLDASKIATGTFATARIPNLDTSKITSGTLGGARIATGSSGNWWAGNAVKVGTDGVMEIGKYIDFHNTDTGTSDFTARITNTGDHLYATGRLYVNSNQRVFADDYHPNADKWTTARTLTLGGDLSGSVSFDGSANFTLSAQVGDDSHFHHRLDSTDDRDMKPNTSGIHNVQAIKPFFSSYGGMTGSANTTYVDVLAIDTYSDSSGGGPSAITFKKGNSAGNPEMHIWHANWNSTTWSTGQRVYADNYHPNADRLTTSRTIAGTSFDGSADIDINYNNLTNKPTIPSVSGLAPIANPTFTGEVNIPNKLRHAGDTDTYLQFPAANQARIVAGNSEVFKCFSTEMRMNKPITINNSANYDETSLSGIGYSQKNAIIHVPSRGVSQNTYMPWIQQSNTHGSGYRTSFVIGAYKQAFLSNGTTQAGWGYGQTGIFMTVGTSDAAPTQEFRFAAGGKIWYTAGGDDTYLDLGTDSTIGLTTSGTERLEITDSLVHVKTPTLRLGVQNTTSGAIDIYGGSSGSEGGEIRLHTTNSYDGSYEWYRIDAFEDDLRIGRTGQTDVIVTSGGRIGIGTSSPSSKLSINSNGAPSTTGNVATTGLTVHNGSGGTAIQMGTYDAGSYNYIQSTYVNSAQTARELRLMVGNSTPLKIHAGGTTQLAGALSMSNQQIYGVNNLRFNDAGAQEGIKWDGGNQWQIYESDNGQGNTSGNLQFTTGSGNGTRRMTITSGGISSNLLGTAAFSRPLLEITNGGTPTQIKITTNIPYSGGSTHAHSVTIRGFQYGSAQMADLQIGWHVYNNQFYNRSVTSSGSWAPTVTLAVENNKVVIHLASPGYWPKLYVESMYNPYGGTTQAEGWSWADSAISADSNTPNQTVPYKTNFGSGATVKVGSHLIYHEGHKPTYSELGTMPYSNLTGAPTIPNISGKLDKSGGTMTGLLEIAKSTSIGDPTLDLHNTTNGNGVNIRMTDVGDQSGQFGYITYYHQDSKSYGSGASIELRTDQSTTTILANGKLMFKEGLYLKPSSGTGAGTQIINSSGAITSPSTVAATEFDLPSNGMLDWANGDARIVEGLVNNYSLSFQTYDGSSASTALRLDGNNTATFTGDVDVPNKIRHAGDTNTYMSFNATDSWKLYCGGQKMIQATEASSGYDYVSFGGTDNSGEIMFNLAAGDGHFDGDLIAYSTTTNSDRKLKKNIQPLERALEKVQNLKGVSFQWKKNDRESIGFIAQEVQEVVPEVVHNNKKEHDGVVLSETLGVDYGNITALLVEAVKEQQSLINRLEERIKDLENKNGE